MDVLLLMYLEARDDANARRSAEKKADKDLDAKDLAGREM